MSKEKTTEPSKIISRITTNRKRQIYFTYETWDNIRRHSNEIPEKYRFLASNSDDYIINGEKCLRLENVICFNGDSQDDIEVLYEFPDKGNVLLL